ncbi:MAG: hypothetical protein JWN76_3064 [Chitinophagaceae bacterium]|nr:hypothetical protein [Chitinophagaceae bacterium]
MKKLFVMLFATGAAALAANAQKLDASKVPATVKVSFSRQFPGVSAKWEKEQQNYEAGFTQGGHASSALFEANGTFLESEIAIKASGLPAKVNAYIAKHHSGKNIREAAKITKADGEINYEAEVIGQDLIFDANGNFVKEVKA